MLDKNRQLDTETSVFALGRQLTIEYYDCAPDAFLDENHVEQVLVSAAKDSGATVITSNFHRFDPQGVSGVVIIAESHFTVHAWPEHDYAAVDIFTCGDSIDLDTAVDVMKKGFDSRRTVISSDKNRGILKPGVTIGQPYEKNTCTRLQDGGNDHILPISWKQVCDNAGAHATLASVDVYGCNVATMSDDSRVKAFASALCRRIGVCPAGACQVTPAMQNNIKTGVTMTQPIENALISGHFVFDTEAAYIDIFCVKFYEPRDAAEFALEYLDGDHYKLQMTQRT